MGRKLTNKLNVDNSDADFPNGRIQDDTGLNDGTPLDEDVYGDIHQTEERLLQEIAAEPDSIMNELPDNKDNGYQFFHVRRKVQAYAERYKNGFFLDAGTPFGTVDSIKDCAVWNNEIYVSPFLGLIVLQKKPSRLKTDVQRQGKPIGTTAPAYPNILQPNRY